MGYSEYPGALSEVYNLILRVITNHYVISQLPTSNIYFSQMCFHLILLLFHLKISPISTFNVIME